MKKAVSISTRLRRLGACQPAVMWAKSFKDEQVAWDSCEKGSYLLWVLDQFAGPPVSERRKQLVRAADACVRLELPHTKYTAVHKCLEAPAAWARGEATLDQVRQAYLTTVKLSKKPHSLHTLCMIDIAMYMFGAVRSIRPTTWHVVTYLQDISNIVEKNRWGDDIALCNRRVEKQCADIIRTLCPHPPKEDLLQ